MKKLTCDSLIHTNCPFVAEGENDDEIVKMMQDHGGEANADLMEGKSDEEAKEANEAMGKMMHENITED